MKGFLLLLISAACGCSSAAVQHKPETVRFALTGSTHSESPFKPASENLPQLFTMIGSDNPVFIIHLGNIIAGGQPAGGITREDIKKQYNQELAIILKNNPIIYFVPGENDIYDKSPSFFEEFTKKPPYYSFNYGLLHFIILNSIDPVMGTISNAQIKWLENDLKEYARSSGVFVFIHTPVLLPDNMKYLTHIQDNAPLHSLFLKGGVKYVFSSTDKQFFNFVKDGITYINAGVTPVNEKFRSQNDYYLADFVNGVLTLEGKRKKNP